jgi:release factor glutamine methyltransferase
VSEDTDQTGAAEPLLTVGGVVARAAEFFRGKGIASARLDSELLVGEALGLDRLGVYMNMDKPVSAAERDRARELVRRRGQREPVAYILGRREFHSRDFAVGPGVLVPRPETELLVDLAIEKIRSRFGKLPECRVLEFGAGSGAICVSIAADLPQVRVVATEISAAALDFARRNAERHGVADRIEFRLQPDFAGIEGPFQALVANPPYVNPADKPAVSPEVMLHEPQVAVFADDAGMALVRQVARDGLPLLAADGFALVEIGAGQDDRAEAAASGIGYSRVEVLPDYAGIPRIVLLEP